jgi:KDO2-lipid IV(A) lauroyltransferase
MKLRKRIQRIGESLLARFALAVLPSFPRRLIFRMSRVLGSLAFTLPTLARRIALANLELVYGDSLSEAEKKKIIRDSFRTVALMALDCFWFTRNTGERLRTYVEFDSSFKVYYKTKPAVVVTSHFGNWEVLGVGMAFQGHPCVSVAAPLPNPTVGRILNRFRQTTGQRIVSKQGALRALLSALKKGERVALLLDQNTLPGEGGEFVKFFGRDVPVSRAAARLSMRTGTAVVFIFCAPTDDGHYVAWASGPLDPREWGGDNRKFNQAIANVIEEQIRNNPTHWTWTYKRWKYIPPGEPREAYPYYAKPYVKHKN